MYTSSSGRSYGSGLRSTEFTMLNMALLAPMPNARVAMTRPANAGLAIIPRSAYFRSWSIGSSLSSSVSVQTACGSAPSVRRVNRFAAWRSMPAARSRRDVRYQSSPLHSWIQSWWRASGTMTPAMRTTRMQRS
jgi:hypothetical protein